MIALVTPRLVLRPWTPSDLEPFASLCADAEVMRFIGDGSTRSRDQVHSMLERNEQSWQDHGWGLFAAERLDTGAFIGFCGLVLPDQSTLAESSPEIGWRLARAHWGQGLATEATTATLDWVFSSRSGPERLVALVRTANTASQRVAAKVGMRLDRRSTLRISGADVEIYEITRSQWSSAG